MNELIIFIIDNLESKGVITFSAEIITLFTGIILLKSKVLNRDGSKVLFYIILPITMYMVYVVQFNIQPKTFMGRYTALIIVSISYLKYLFIAIGYEFWVDNNPEFPSWFYKSCSYSAIFLVLSGAILDSFSISTFVFYKLSHYNISKSTHYALEYAFMFIVVISMIKYYYNYKQVRNFNGKQGQQV